MQISRLLIACAASIVLCASLTGCKPRNSNNVVAEPIGARIQLDTLGLSLILPAGWQVEKQQSASIGGKRELALAHIRGSSRDSSAYYDLLITRHENLGMLKRFSWAQGWNTSTEERQAWRLVEEIPSGDERMTFESGAGFIYRWSGRGEAAPGQEPATLAARFYVYYLVQGSQAYRISIGGTEADFTEMTGVYQRMLRSMRFI